MVILMATLFWALWDEDFGQRPWKAFQHEWKDRYSTFLKTARSQSGDAQKEVEASADYQKRSEERRVGKECRSRWSPYGYTRKYSVRRRGCRRWATGRQDSPVRA